MIIKEKSIKSYVALERVLQYIFTKDVEDKSFVFKRFIKGDRMFVKQLEATSDIETRSMITEKRLNNMVQQYKNNDKVRLFKRKGETKFYHCILSFHTSDKLTQKQLLLTAKQYAKKRFPKSMVVATSHLDTEHQHIHLVGSNVEYGLGTTRYLSKKEFSQIKQDMEKWQDKELNLVYSRINHSKKKSSPLVKMPNIKSTYKESKVKNRRLHSL